jgi:pimeloyl-ACP methyl ester carboxylesterase
MATFVLVPGAWLSGAVWDQTRGQLLAAGHEVIAVTLPGLGGEADSPAASIGLGTHVAHVVDLLEARELRDVVLVGHSYGGAVVTGVVTRAAPRIRRLVYLAGAVLPAGMSMFDLLGPDAAAGLTAAAAAAGDPDRLPVPGQPELDMFYGEHGLTGELFDRFRDNAVPHPIGTFREPLAAGAYPTDSVPRTYLHCDADGPVRLPADAPGWTIRILPTGHWPMLTMPVETASAIAEGSRPGSDQRAVMR